MKNKLGKITLAIFVALLWISVWYITALLINKPLILPNPYETAIALFELLGKGEFYKVVFFTMLRVLLGLILGIVTGISLALICHKFSAIKLIFSPLISVIRSTPVASYIVLLWVMLDGGLLSIVVAFLMVMPVVWQNTLDGFSSIPKELLEVADVYEISPRRRYEILVMPVLFNYIFPAIITSVGLAWKSEVAAEIIAYTKDSIGMHINDAKLSWNIPTVFAWTAIIIVMSIFLEALTNRLLRRTK